MQNEKVKSVLKATHIIECLSQGEKGLVEVAKEVGLHVATARRLLLTLVDTNFVQQNEENKKYSLSLKILLIAKRASNNLDLRRISLPYLKELMRKSNETANLVIEDSNKAVYIEQVECQNSLRTANKVGSRAPMYCTAVGKILLSSRSEEEREKYVRSVSLVPFSPNTITDKDKLLAELKTVSRTNVAVDNEEQVIGERCLAAPIRDLNGDVVAAISISGPSVRLPMNRIEELKPTILEVSLNISQRLGFESLSS